jgi:putative oxidoreductase
MWNLVYALGRVAVVAIFIWSGVGKFIAPATTNAMIVAKGFPMPMVFTYAAGAVEVVLGLMVAVGWQTRLASLGLVAFTIVASLFIHDWWNMTGPARLANQIAFMKNVSIIGGLMMIMAAGAGRFSAERR